jgi:hypothetical protein
VDLDLDNSFEEDKTSESNKEGKENKKDAEIDLLFNGEDDGDDELCLADLSTSSEEFDSLSETSEESSSEEEIKDIQIKQDKKEQLKKYMRGKLKFAKYIAGAIKNDPKKENKGSKSNPTNRAPVFKEDENGNMQEIQIDQKPKKSKKGRLLHPPTDQHYQILDYRNFKDAEYRKFFTKGMKDKPTKSGFVIFINFFLFFRLGIFDICYLTLSNLPQFQISCLITLEFVFFFMIQKCMWKYKLFSNWFEYTRLTWQSVAILFWLFLSLIYSFKLEGVQKNGLRVVEYHQYFSPMMGVKMQWWCLFLLFFALFFEILHVFHNMVKSIRDWFRFRKRAKEYEQRKKERRQRRKEKKLKK